MKRLNPLISLMALLSITALYSCNTKDKDRISLLEFQRDSLIDVIKDLQKNSILLPEEDTLNPCKFNRLTVEDPATARTFINNFGTFANNKGIFNIPNSRGYFLSNDNVIELVTRISKNSGSGFFFQLAADAERPTKFRCYITQVKCTPGQGSSMEFIKTQPTEFLYQDVGCPVSCVTP